VSNAKGFVSRVSYLRMMTVQRLHSVGKRWFYECGM